MRILSIDPSITTMGVVVLDDRKVLNAHTFKTSAKDELEDNVNRCRCSNCGCEYDPTDLKMEQEQECWEMPPYWVHICPTCPDGGCIDDYWFDSTKERK